MYTLGFICVLLLFSGVFFNKQKTTKTKNTQNKRKQPTHTKKNKAETHKKTNNM